VVTSSLATSPYPIPSSGTARPVLPGTAPAARACAAAYSASSSTIVAAGASADATRTFSRVMPA